ncbi:MAG: TolC family protein [Bacteroidales bacterium]|nr:TolC family protein [Bacteroidales bacterium]
MNYKNLLFILLTAVAGTTTAQDTVRMTLDSCLRYAHQHNLQVQTALLNKESSDVSLTGAKMRFLPSVSASASQGWSWDGQSTSNTQYGINGSLTLFSGLSNLRSLQQSRLSNEQSALKVQQTENSIDIQIVQAYLTILMNREKLSYQQEVLETSHQQQLEGEVKYQVGRILESDYLLLEASYTSAQAELDNTQITIEDNRMTLATLLSMDLNTPIDVVPTDDTLRATDRMLPLRDSVLVQAQRSMPDWQISAMDVSLARLNVRLAESSFMPTLSLNAGYGGQWMPNTDGSSGTTFGDNTSLTLGLNIPIFNQGSNITQYKQSKIALQQAELQHQQTLIDLEGQLDELYLNTQQALNRYRASEALCEAYRASYEVYVLKYAEGAVTTVELLQQQDRYLSALNDYLQNKYSYLLAEKQLDIYTGKEIKL